MFKCEKYLIENRKTKPGEVFDITASSIRFVCNRGKMPLSVHKAGELQMWLLFVFLFSDFKLLYILSCPGYCQVAPCVFTF